MVLKKKAGFFSVITAAVMLSALLAGCGTADKEEETSMTQQAATDARTEAPTDAPAAETTAPGATEKETVTQSALSEYSKKELHCKYDEVDIFGTLYMPGSEKEKYPAVILSHGYNCIGNDM